MKAIIKRIEDLKGDLPYVETNEDYFNLLTELRDSFNKLNFRVVERDYPDFYKQNYLGFPHNFVSKVIYSIEEYNNGIKPF